MWWCHSKTHSDSSPCCLPLWLQLPGLNYHSQRSFSSTMAGPGLAAAHEHGLKALFQLLSLLSGNSRWRRSHLCCAEQGSKACGCWEAYATGPLILQRRNCRVQPSSPSTSVGYVLDCYKVNNNKKLWEMWNLPYTPIYFTLISPVLSF